MKIIIYLLILFLESIFSSSIVVLPFQVNQINFLNKKYSSTELINLLFETELYTPIMLGSENQISFGILSLETHHPILSEANCEKMKLFQNNKDIAKKGFIISNSKTSILFGNGTNYHNIFKSVEVYSEQFSYFNTTLIEENKNNNSIITDIILVKDNSTNTSNLEMCLSLGLGKYARSFINPEPPHFIDDLRSKNIIKNKYWTLKFTDQNNGLLIIGSKPDEYENDTIKYYEKNYTQEYSKSYLSYIRIWAIEMKEIYFYNNTNDKLFVIKNNNNKIELIYNFGFIIGSNNYKQLIIEYYFKELINKNICELEISEKTIYNTSTVFIKKDGKYSIIICDKIKMDNLITKFPPLYFSSIAYNYIFELTYKDLFININNYYYFMILFPNNESDTSLNENWYMGLPFLKKYQFILSLDDKTIGFYRSENKLYEEENNNDNDNKQNEIVENKETNKIWIYILQILLVIILVISAVFVGMLLNRQRKKRANELKDDYDYIEENNNDLSKNNLIN